MKQNDKVTTPLLREPSDFSLVLGGPLYQLFRRSHLSGDALELLHRRIVAVALITWLPLLLLSAIDGRAWGGAVKLPFLYDVTAYTRFLIALPLLILAELVVHKKLRELVEHFPKSQLVSDAVRPKFDATIASALRLRNSVFMEVLLVVFVYALGALFVWRRLGSAEVTTWFATSQDGELHRSLAGWWYTGVSLPLLQFLLLRWYFRLFIWGRFLWQVARLELRINPAHPDRAGGLGFLSESVGAFAVLIFAQGVMLTGVMANQILFHGMKLPQLKMEFIAAVVVLLVVVLLPLFFFIPQLARAKRTAILEYGSLGQRYVREFDHKWLRGGAPADEALMGSADIQSLADLAGSFEIVREMKLILFTKRNVLQVAVLALLPAVPLVLTMIPLDALIKQLMKMVF